jgi:Protein of unknown function (DUF3102)
MKTNARALSKIETDLEAEFKREAESPISIGRLLLKAKELLDAHGEWLAWLKNHFPHAVRTAQRCMSAAEFADKYATVSHLKLAPSALYALAAADNRGNDALVQAVLREAETAWIDRDRVGQIERALSAPPASDDEPPRRSSSDDEPPTSEPPAPPPPAPALTPKAAALVASFDNAVEAFKPLLAKRVADFVASAKPDYELQEIANFLLQIVAARRPTVDEQKQIAPPPALSPPSTSAPTITLDVSEYAEERPKLGTAGTLDVPALVARLRETETAPQAAAPDVTSEPSDFERKMARGEGEEVGDFLAAGGGLSQLRDVVTDPDKKPIVEAYFAKGGTVTHCSTSRRRAA